MSYIRIEESFGEIHSVNLADFKAQLDELAKSIGATDETAFVTIELEAEYGDHWLVAKIWRDETKQEYTERVAIERDDRTKREAAKAECAAAIERSTYERLKAKYG